MVEEREQGKRTSDGHPRPKICRLYNDCGYWKNLGRTVRNGLICFLRPRAIYLMIPPTPRTVRNRSAFCRATPTVVVLYELFPHEREKTTSSDFFPLLEKMIDTNKVNCHPSQLSTRKTKVKMDVQRVSKKNKKTKTHHHE